MSESDRERLAECVARRLAPRERRVFDLARDDDLTYIEIAERVGESESEVRRLMISAMTACREECLAIGRPPLDPELSPFVDFEPGDDATPAGVADDTPSGDGFRFLAQITDHLADDVSMEDRDLFQDRGETDPGFRAEGELLSWIWNSMPSLHLVGKDGKYRPPSPAEIRAMWDSLETDLDEPKRRNRPAPSDVVFVAEPLTPEAAAARAERAERWAKIEMAETYLCCEMSAREMRAFEERLRSDTAFREAVEGAIRFDVRVARQCASSPSLARRLARIEAEQDWNRFVTLVGDSVRRDIRVAARHAMIHRLVSAVSALFGKAPKAAPTA